MLAKPSFTSPSRRCTPSLSLQPAQIALESTSCTSPRAKMPNCRRGGDGRSRSTDPVPLGHGRAPAHWQWPGRCARTGGWQDVGVTPSRPRCRCRRGRTGQTSGAPLSSQQVGSPRAREVVLPQTCCRLRRPQRRRLSIARRSRASAGLAYRPGLNRSGAGCGDDCRSDSRRCSPMASVRAVPCRPARRISAQGMPVTRVIDGRSVGGPAARRRHCRRSRRYRPALPGPKRPLRASLGIGSGVELSLATAFWSERAPRHRFLCGHPALCDRHLILSARRPDLAELSPRSPREMPAGNCVQRV